ncbi:hypothetical protein B0H99_1341 [Planomicrobium soli]|uniref:Uncharacterized protein n=1 Tax=Planomicrobium soli TaxID=1176648 RepID=A0A2P8FMA6_9BACL|nr:hypothetical protein B0H99_1341 [Planomicrobium soli]
MDRRTPSASCVAKAMEFFGIRKASFNGLAAQFIKLRSTFGSLVLADPFFFGFPNMAGDGPLVARRRKAFGAQRAICAVLWSALVLPVALPVRRRIGQFAAHRAGICLHRIDIGEQAFRQLRAPVLEPAVAHDRKDALFVEFFADMPREITGIQRDRFHVKAKLLLLNGQTVQVPLGIAGIARRDEGVRNEVVLGIDGPLVQVEEPVRLLVPHQKSAVGIRQADTGGLDFQFAGSRRGFQGFFPCASRSSWTACSNSAK